ncbi:hypothetical protein UFOVP267_57 [uncultured Caudovirales phage]|uniref:Uncharacterized protein n=1 Tax=uncultured Caudovirales phage TaxID=2100421 RepID=A0A6J5LLM6_9CAUD|nr:hypothetical protein UFOVP267_57 [uncultured Caudovirales phage]
MSVSVNGTNGLTFNDGSMQNTSAYGGGFAMRNRIINGAMVIDQRNAGASVTALNTAPFTVDRFYALSVPSSKYTVQQSSTAPTGFTKSVVITSASAYTVTSGDYFLYRQVIEGFNCADLGWGTASAATVTLSFWVRSSLTGTFGSALNNGASNRSYPFSYTISAANTWEQKTITIAGDTTGTWATDNSGGIVVSWSIGMGSTYTGTANAWAGTFYGAPTGSTNLVSTNGATLYITGVQLEKGSTATSFDYRPYGTELALCQRYLPAFNAVAAGDTICSAYMQSTTNMRATFVHKVSTRVAPTGLTATSGSTFSFSGVAGVNGSGSLAFLGGSTEASFLQLTVGVTTAGVGGQLSCNTTPCQILMTGCEL